MNRFYTKFVLIAFAVTLMADHCLAQGISIEQAESCVRQLVNKEGVVCRYAGIVAAPFIPEKKCFSFKNEGENLQIWIDVESGAVRKLLWAKEEIESKIQNISAPQSLKVITELLAKAHTLNNEFVLQDQKFVDQGDAGKVYNFKWVKKSESIILPTYLEASLSAQSGRIIAVSLTEFKVILKSLTPKISQDAAKKIAMQNLSQDKEGLENIHINSVNLCVTGANQNQILGWTINGEAQRSEKNKINEQTANPVKVLVLINAIDGALVRKYVIPIPVQKPVTKLPMHPSAYSGQDSWPNFQSSENRGVVFYTTRKSMRVVQKEDDEMAVLALTNKGKISALLSTPFLCRYPAVTQDGNRIAMDMWLGGQIYILDLKTGTIGQCNDGKRVRRGMPSWDATGKLLAMSGTHSPADAGPRDDEDIFVAQIAPFLSKVSMERQWCVARLPGRDILPVFSPTGKWIAFAHEEPVSPKATQASVNSETNKRWAIYKVRPDKSQYEGEILQKIVDGLSEPERLSFFPDGKRVLVSFSERNGQPLIVDIEGKTSQPFKLPPLRDPDLRGGPLLEPRELALNPTGTKIAFSAYSWSGKPEDTAATCIYTCNLDGSDLKRITPPENVPLEPFQYPQTGITALNAWEKLEPKPNLGKPWSLEIQMQERQKELEEREKKKKASAPPAEPR